jgi:hydrogenase maturation protease
MTARILVAGVGNIFFTDDGFGVEVARSLAAVEMPDTVRVVDYGIRGVHLAYDLLHGYDITILVDALSRGEPPGTVYVLDACGAASLSMHPRQFDPHGMTPDAVLEHVGALGGSPGHVYVVGCEPADTSEGIGLTDAVAAAIPQGVAAVQELVAAALRGVRHEGEHRHGEQDIDQPSVIGIRDAEV